MSKSPKNCIRRGIVACTALGLAWAVPYGLGTHTWDAVLDATWNAAGDTLIRRDLDALEARLANARKDQVVFRTLRDSVARQLEGLKLRRDEVRTRIARDQTLLEEAHAWERFADDPRRAAEPSRVGAATDAIMAAFLESSRDLARLEAALLSLEDVLSSADLKLNAAESRLETRTGELAMLRAGASGRDLRHAEETLKDPYAGSDRPARVVRILGGGQASAR